MRFQKIAERFWADGKKNHKQHLQEFWQDAHPDMFNVCCDFDAAHDVPETTPERNRSIFWFDGFEHECIW